MCALQSEDGEYNGACCHDRVLLWSLPQRMDGCAQPPYYASQPAEKVRQHAGRSGESNQRYSSLNLGPFLPADASFYVL